MPMLELYRKRAKMRGMKVRCPSCEGWTEWEKNPHRPFCSETCKNRDLGHWATERYRIPEHEAAEESEPTAKRDTEEESRRAWTCG